MIPDIGLQNNTKVYNYFDQLIVRLTKKMSDDTTVVEDAPQISHEDYLELVSMRQSILELKAQKSDVLEFLNQAQQIVAQAQQVAPQLQPAQERVNLLNEALGENSQALQERMKELVEPFGISGEFTVSDTEPHLILKAD